MGLLPKSMSLSVMRREYSCAIHRHATRLPFRAPLSWVVSVDQVLPDVFVLGKDMMMESMK